MAGYGSDTGYLDYLNEMGYDAPTGDLSVANLRARGSAYIDALYAARFPGEPVDGIEQDRAWGRIDAQDIYGNDIADGSIPSRVIKASYEAAYLEQLNPGSLSVLVIEAERLKRIKAGSVEIEYADSKAYTSIDGASVMSTAIEGLLYPLIASQLALPGILAV